MIKYIDSNFEGPLLFLCVRFGYSFSTFFFQSIKKNLYSEQDPAKQQFAKDLLSFTESFNKGVITSFKAGGMNDTNKLNTLADFVRPCSFK